MAPEDVAKTAFATPFSLYQSKVMPFGLAKTPAIFEWMMQYVLSGFHWETCLIHLDDVIIFSKAFEEHIARLHQLLTRLKEANLKLPPSKCKLFHSHVEYFSHVVSKDGVVSDLLDIHFYPYSLMRIVRFISGAHSSSSTAVEPGVTASAMGTEVSGKLISECTQCSSRGAWSHTFTLQDTSTPACPCSTSAGTKTITSQKPLSSFPAEDDLSSPDYEISEGVMNTDYEPRSSTVTASTQQALASVPYPCSSPVTNSKMNPKFEDFHQQTTQFSHLLVCAFYVHDLTFQPGQTFWKYTRSVFLWPHIPMLKYPVPPASYTIFHSCLSWLDFPNGSNVIKST